MKKKVYLLDGNNFIYRMFFAIPEFSTKQGEVVNAVFGMAKFFANSLCEYNPDYVFFVKDAKGKNFRHDIFEEYKATRDRMPDNLRSQISYIEEMIDKMNIGKIEAAGFEADDLIGTLATQLGATGDHEVVILSGDKDLYSLVGDNIKIYDTMKRRLYGPEETKDKYQIDSTMIIDYLAIMGDAADNIPGIEGFGPKKAVTLINSIGSVEEIYAVVDRVEAGELIITDQYPEALDLHKLFKGKTYEKLVAGKEKAFLSKQLATIDLDVDLGESYDLENFAFRKDEVVNTEVNEFFEKMEFHSLLPKKDIKRKTWQDTGLKVITVSDNSELQKLESKFSEFSVITLDTETTSLDVIDAELVGVSIYLDDSNIYYINRLHAGEHVTENQLINFIQNLLNSEKTIVGHNLKYDLEILERFLSGEASNNISDDEDQMSFAI